MNDALITRRGGHLQRDELTDSDMGLAMMNGSILESLAKRLDGNRIVTQMVQKVSGSYEAYRIVHRITIGDE